MSIFDRNMFRPTSAVSPNVTVIGESGGGARPQMNMPPPSAEIGIGSFERPEFEVNPIIDNVVTNTPEVITDSGLGENQIRLSTGEIITVDPSNLSNIVNSDALFFFQAEDGIRDQPRSRGLGDVYKRQVLVVLKDLSLK